MFSGSFVDEGSERRPGQNQTFDPEPKGSGFFCWSRAASEERKAKMISRYQGVAGAAVVALAAFLLGLSINSSRTAAGFTAAQVRLVYIEPAASPG